MNIEGIRGERRAYPRFWDYCAYMLNCLRKRMLSILSSELAAKSDAIIIDYGCGERPYEKIFKDLAAQYIGVDLEGNPQADLSCDLEGHVPLESKYGDIVVSIQVLEHVTNVSGYLEECYRLLKPGGLLLLSTHGIWVYHPYPQDVQRWTCWGLQYEIEKHGFSVELRKGCVGPLAYTTQLRLQLLRGALWNLRPLSIPCINVIAAFSHALMVLEDFITPQKVAEENSAIYIVAARKPSN